MRSSAGPSTRISSTENNNEEVKHRELLFFFTGFLSGVIVGTGPLIAVAIKSSLGNKKDKGGDAK